MHGDVEVQASEIHLKDDDRKKTQAPRYCARSVHVARPSRPQRGGLSARHENAGTNRVRLAEAEALVQKCDCLPAMRSLLSMAARVGAAASDCVKHQFVE